MQIIFRKKYITLLIIVVSFIISRLILLFFAIDKFLTVDFTKGYVAKEIMKGNRLSLFEYELHNQYQFGFHLVPLFIIPFFLIFGETYFSIKMVHLALSLGTLIFWFLFLDNITNRKIAVLSSLFFILSPFRFTISFLRPVGMQTDLCFFTILNLYLFYKLIVKSNIQSKKFVYLFFFLFGISNGFATSYGYIYFITLFCILLFWLGIEKKIFFTKKFLFFLLGFIIGILPWFCFNLFHDFKGIMLGGLLEGEIRLDKIFRLRNIFKKINYVLLEQMAYVFWNENLPLIIRKITSVYYYIIVIIAFVTLYYKKRRELLQLIINILSLNRYRNNPFSNSLFNLLILVYPTIFMIIYFLTPFYKIRYFDLLMPFFFAGLAMFILYNNNVLIKNLKLVFLALPILLLGFIGNFGNISFKDFGDIFRYRGYEYGEYGRVLADKYMRGLLEFKDVNSALNNLNILDTHAAYADFASHLISPLGFNPNLNIFNSIVSNIDMKYRHYFYYQLGKRVCEEYFSKDLITGFKILYHLDNKFIPFFIKSFANTIGHMFNRTDRGDIKISFNKVIDCLELAKDLNSDYKEYFSFGFGYAVGRLYADNIYSSRDIKNLLKEVDFRNKNEFYKGVGYGLSSEYIISPGYIMGSERGEYPMDFKLFKSLIKLIDELCKDGIEQEYKGNFYEGIMLFWGEYWIKGIEDNYYGNIDIDIFIKYLGNKDPALINFIYRGLGEGMSRFTTNYFESFEYNRFKRIINFSKKISEKYLSFYYEGLGKGYSSRYGLDKEVYEYIINQINSQRLKDSFVLGLQAQKLF